MAETAHPTRDPDATQLIELAELTLATARKLRRLGHTAPGGVELTPSEALVMQHIDRHPGATSAVLASCLGLQASNTSTAVRSLQAKGFVRREIDAEDRRVIRLYPTKAAADNLDRVRDAWVRELSRVFTSGPGLGIAIETLGRLDAALDASAGPDAP